MAPEEFRPRFIKALPEVPAELDLGLDEFFQFSETALSKHGLGPVDGAFLIQAGLPKQASPFLSFSNQADLSHLPPGFFPIGFDSCGSNICIELSSGNMVLLDHDLGMKRVFLNSSLSQFAECLCIYQEHRKRREMSGCFQAMCQIDSELNCQGGWWQNEIAGTQLGS